MILSAGKALLVILIAIVIAYHKKYSSISKNILTYPRISRNIQEYQGKYMILSALSHPHCHRHSICSCGFFLFLCCYVSLHCSCYDFKITHFHCDICNSCCSHNQCYLHDYQNQDCGMIVCGKPPLFTQSKHALMELTPDNFLSKLNSYFRTLSKPLRYFCSSPRHPHNNVKIYQIFHCL